ncbi:MAG: signal peptidase I [Clostridia bacterium]|nr:signal peptidase I [Clostridia bacterium]
MANKPHSSAKDSDFGRAVVVQVFEWLDVLVTALIAVVIIFSLIFRVATIDGTSMESTLHGGEKVIITNVGYEPQRGDVVVVYRENDKPIIKRVIAVAGETVEIRPDGNVYVDGSKLEERYLDDSVRTDPKELKSPLTVEPGKIFVLGDNREVSLDSRYDVIGQVDVNNILGHAILRIFPLNKFGGI